MAPSLKPPARARRVRALSAGPRTALTEAALQELFRAARVLTEGDLDGAARWYGSVLITFDLAVVRAACRGLDDPREQARFLDAVEGSVRVRVLAHRLACAEVYRRYPDREIGTAIVESRFAREEGRLLLDVDLEVGVDLPSERSGS